MNNIPEQVENVPQFQSILQVHRNLVGKYQQKKNTEQFRDIRIQRHGQNIKKNRNDPHTQCKQQNKIHLQIKTEDMKKYKTLKTKAQAI